MARLCLSVVLLFLGMGPSVVSGQEQQTEVPKSTADEAVSRIVEAFGQGTAQRLLTPSADRVEVGLFGTRTFYSNAQAFYVLRDFFESYPPHRFSVSDTTQAGESCFVMGEYEHTRGERSLQVYVRLVQDESHAWRLHEVRISKGIE